MIKDVPMQNVNLDGDSRPPVPEFAVRRIEVDPVPM
jgi:hypothetical protein